MADEIIIDRNYVDNFSVKEMVVNTLVPKFYPDTDVSLRTVGTVGMQSELISNISEDAFNTASIYYRESIPNRATLPESIYSHAALFQLSNSFSTAATCRFVVVLDEASIVKNADYSSSNGIGYFYIDKDTVIYVEDIPFTFDYDIMIKVLRKTNDVGDDEYVFTASYVTTPFKNSTSDINNPYIKLRKDVNGYIGMDVTMHQSTRMVEYETIVNNATVNHPIIDIPFDGKLAGFDILYKSATDTDFSTQLETRLTYSDPTVNPFCYYELADENTLRITFNSRDGYFMPDFNSEIAVTVYITEGVSGNFDVYTGNNVKVSTTSDRFPYADSYLLSAKPLSGSFGGSDQLTTEALQSKTVEAYRTAKALTTSADLDNFFDNYGYDYGDAYVKFVKMRDDVRERAFTGYTVIQKNDYKFKTNTMNLAINLSDMTNPETNVYTLKPGMLFTYDTEDDSYATFVRDKVKYDTFYENYLEACENGEIPYIPDTIDKSELPAYLNRNASYAEYKARLGIDDKLAIFDLSEEEMEAMDSPENGKFLYFNPFLVRFKKNPNIISMYLTHVYQTSALDYIYQNDTCFVQFSASEITLRRKFTDEDRYTLTTTVLPSISIDTNTYPLIDANIITDATSNNTVKYIVVDRFNLENNDLRVVIGIADSNGLICFSEMIPTESESTTSLVFKDNLFTDDHITSDGMLRLLPRIQYYEPDTKDYYMVTEDALYYNKYKEDGTVIEKNVAIDIVTKRIADGELKIFKNITNISSNDDIMIPMDDVVVYVYTLYRRVYDSATGQLELTMDSETDNIFAEYDSGYRGYICTNYYNTTTDSMTFMKPLPNIRSTLSYQDYTEYSGGRFTHDIMDVVIKSLPFARWDLIKDEELMDYFMASFLSEYEALTSIINTRLREVTNIDVKFYNTYGKSKNYLIGEDSELLNTVNLKIVLDVWFVNGTDLTDAISDLQSFIQSEVQSINTGGTNNLYISNLTADIKSNFPAVDHMRFRSINGFDSSYQTVKVAVSDLDELDKASRRNYVPELLCVDLDDITINAQTM